MFEFKITSIDAGWLDAEIMNEDNEITYLTASYLNDMPKILLERLNKLALQQNGEYTIPIFQEPGIEIWHIRKENDIVDYTIYRLINFSVAISDQQDKANDNFQLTCKQDYINQVVPVIILQSSDCYKISLENNTLNQTVAWTINKLTFENTEEFKTNFKGKTSFFELFNNIVREMGKYSCGENLDFYNKEWSNGRESGFKFPADEYNKSVLILNKLQKNNI